jgi:hypothetical protein
MQLINLNCNIGYMIRGGFWCDVRMWFGGRFFLAMGVGRGGCWDLRGLGDG